MSFIERLQYYMELNGINDNRLTIDAGLSVGLIGKAKKTGKAMTSANIEKILLAYPDLSADWLMTGTGPMLRNSDSAITMSQFDSIPLVNINKRNERSISEQKNTKLIPRIPFSAEAGALSIVANSVAFDQCEKFPIISMFPRYDFTMIIHGDSMEPDFKSGDEVACQIVDDPRRIQWGRAHILDTMDGAVLKRIYKCDEGVLCRSINPEYSEYIIPNEDILKVALVVGTLRRY